jgi:FkbM family methyltransferase
LEYNIKTFKLKKICDYKTIEVIDVGAMDIQGVPTIYSQLDNYNLTGFEPDEKECQKLNGIYGKKFFPVYVGDGEDRMFHHCNYNMTSSFFEPNTDFLEMFNYLAEVTTVVSTEKIKTTRLDDIIDDADYLKIDVQGAELDVFRGADKLLDKINIINTEVCFVPLYKGQPLFAEIDQALRKKGFMFHRFASINLMGRTLKPLIVNKDENFSLSQKMWTDAIYIRDLRKFDEIPADKLLKLAAILNDVYLSLDFAHLALVYYDQKTGTNLAVKYLKLLQEN